MKKDKRGDLLPEAMCAFPGLFCSPLEDLEPERQHTLCPTLGA